MEGKVEAVLAGEKSIFPADDREEEDAKAAAAASPAAIFASLASLLSLLRHIACLCAGYLGIAGGRLKPFVPAPASSSSSSASAAACQGDEVDAAASEDCTDVAVQVQPRGSPQYQIHLRNVPRKIN